MRETIKSQLNQLTYRQKMLAICAVASTVCLLLWVFLKHKSTQSTVTRIEQPLKLPKPSQVLIDQTLEEPQWQEITTKPGDSLATLFKFMGINTQTLHAIMKNNPHAKALTQIKPNQVVQFLIKNHELDSLVIGLSKSESFTIKRVADHFETQRHTQEMNIKPETVTGTIHHSLYTTAKKTQIPYTLMQQMASILAYQINFSRDLREGDRFSIHYEAFYLGQDRIRTGQILSVSYTNQGKTYQAFRHQTRDGRIDYFTKDGKSLRKAFTRYPLQFSHISSNFNLSRMHPILKKRRPHRGIDLAAPIGTPIHATSDGRIISIGYENGYGNKIIIRHTGPYESLYAHLLKFRKGLKYGDAVKRGEVIGYVGQTGLADGPHCHYEFRINHQPHNPATVALPEASPIAPAELAEFKRRVDTELAALETLSTHQQQIT